MAWSVFIVDTARHGGQKGAREPVPPLQSSWPAALRSVQHRAKSRHVCGGDTAAHAQGGWTVRPTGPVLGPLRDTSSPQVSRLSPPGSDGRSRFSDPSSPVLAPPLRPRRAFLIVSRTSPPRCPCPGLSHATCQDPTHSPPSPTRLPTCVLSPS